MGCKAMLIAHLLLLWVCLSSGAANACARYARLPIARRPVQCRPRPSARVPAPKPSPKPVVARPRTTPRVSPAVTSRTRFGILYALWHCLAKDATYDMTQIMAGAPPGPKHSFHWWGRPRDGYYCLTDRPDLFRLHATQLRDAGVSYVVIDATNWPLASPGPPLHADVAITAPFEAMLREWVQVPGAPKIVPWCPATRLPEWEGQKTMFEYFVEKLDQNPSIAFNYLGNPLIIASDNKDIPSALFDPAVVRPYESRFTVRKMWADWTRVNDNRWTFLRECTRNRQPNSRGFLNSKGSIPCNQEPSYLAGRPEHLSISTAYQKYIISDVNSESVPKFGGRTFIQQFNSLFNTPGIPLATIVSFNEWIAQRFCKDPNAEDCSWADSQFVDQYGQERNRDIEPSDQPGGDIYLRLLSRCISSYRAGVPCTF